jgi:hypothetical protein
MRYPILGSAQRDARALDEPLALRVQALWYFRAAGGVLAPLNTGMQVDYLGRSAPATIYASDGTSGNLASAAPAFTSIPWATAGVRDDEGLLLSPEEALRYYDAATGELQLVPGPLTILHEWISVQVADVDQAPLLTFTPDDASNPAPAFGLFETVADAGATRYVTLAHDNATVIVTARTDLALGDRGSLVAWLHADGSVESDLLINGATTVVGDRSAANALEPAWGVAGTCKIRLNEWCDSDGDTGTRATQIVRRSAIYGGIATRAQLAEML